MMQEMASGVLKQLSRVSIDWKELTEWEAELLRRLINEVDLLDQFLGRIINYNRTKSLMFRNVNFLFMYCLIMFKSIAVSQDCLKIQLIKSQTCNKCIPSLD